MCKFNMFITAVCVLFLIKPVDIYWQENLILFSQPVFRNFNSTVQISEFIHFHPLLRSHDFRPVLGSFAGPYSTMFYIHARSRVPEFFKGEEGVASTLGYTRGRYYLCSLVSLLHNDIFLCYFI